MRSRHICSCNSRFVGVCVWTGTRTTRFFICADKLDQSNESDRWYPGATVPLGKVGSNPGSGAVFVMLPSSLGVCQFTKSEPFLGRCRNFDLLVLLLFNHSIRANSRRLFSEPRVQLLA